MKNLEVICFGEILWDNLKKGRRLGGAPLNVCYHLSKMGVNAKIITQIGDDEDGRAIMENLYRLGVNTDTIFVSNTKPTSTVEVILREKNKVEYEILEDVAWDDIQFSSKMEEWVKRSNALIFGSLVARSKCSRETLFKLIEKSRFNVFDVNLRDPFYNKELIFLLLNKTNLLKLNQEELYEISRWLGGSSDCQNAIKLIQKNFPNIKEILLTRGQEGAVYISGKTLIKVQAYEVKVKDTVGSGDSFLAAFMAEKLKGSTITKALEKASLLSGFIATRNGACPVYDLEDLQNFKKTVQFPI